MTVQVCRDHDCACCEVPTKLRCANCPLSQPKAESQQARDAEILKEAIIKAINFFGQLKFALAFVEATNELDKELVQEPPKVSFEDHRVQAVYAVLCSDEVPPDGDHWEGFAARRIVDLFAQPKAEPVNQQLLLEAARYRWLREQPNNTEAPRIDVVYWEKEDEASNSGTGLRMEQLDIAIDAAIAAPEGSKV